MTNCILQEHGTCISMAWHHSFKFGYICLAIFSQSIIISLPLPATKQQTESVITYVTVNILHRLASDGGKHSPDTDH